MASELKMARAFFLVSRSSMSWALDSGLPKTKARTRAMRRPRAVRGALAAALATMTPGPGVAEVGGVRPIDHDAPVAELATVERRTR